MAVAGKADTVSDAEPPDRVQRAAPEYGLEGEGSFRRKEEGEQPALTCIGAFSSGRGDLSRLAAEDAFAPWPSR